MPNLTIEDRILYCIPESYYKFYAPEEFLLTKVNGTVNKKKTLGKASCRTFCYHCRDYFVADFFAAPMMMLILRPAVVGRCVVFCFLPKKQVSLYPPLLVVQVVPRAARRSPPPATDCFTG
jgi:hypothetical protein